MDFVLKGRGVRITEQVRRTAEHKLAKLARLAPDAMRTEIELIEERNPRIDGDHRVEVAVETRLRTYRAEGRGRDMEAALDQVLEHLERRITSHRGKLHDRWSGRGNRLQSPRTSPETGSQ